MRLTSWTTTHIRAISGFTMICARSATGSVRKTVSLLFLPLRTKAWATRSTPKPNAARAGSRNSSRPSTGSSSRRRTTMIFCGSCRKPDMKSRLANTSPSVLKVRSGLPGLKLSERTTPRNASRSGLPDGRPEEAKDRPRRRASLSSEIFRSGSGSSTARATSIKQSCEARPTTRVRFIVIRIVIIHRSILTRKTPQGGIPRVSLYSGEVAAMSVKLLALAMRIMATTSSKATDLSQCSETVGFSCPASRDLRAFSTPSREPTFSVST